MIGFFYKSMDTADNTNVHEKPWRCIIGFFRSFLRLFKRSPPKSKERVSFPRLELPDYDLEFEYNMNHQHRGIALIFNHEFYQNNRRSRRKGTVEDRERLAAILDELNFDVRIFNDFRWDDMFAALKIGKNGINFFGLLSYDLWIIVSLFDHSDNDCLVITIMTHGEVGKISSFDKEYTLTQITSFFTDEACPTLKGKPRIFFIQACRGEMKDKGHLTQNDNQSRYKLKRNSKDRDHRVDHSTPFTQEIREGDEDLVHNPPNNPDFLIIRSAFPCHVSLRNPDTGSWFIQALCQELEENGTKYDILNLLTHVNWSISERISVGEKMKQILCISSMLTKILIFNYKEHNANHCAIPSVNRIDNRP